MTSAAVGAISIINAATSDEMEGITGKYFGKKGEEKPNEKFYSAENEQMVWDYCKKVTEEYL